ncbi:hypothetical protein LR48_Vigan05g073700 [Vigna angularis]|uniref:Ubiquitin-like protease family profile domain-containing protein n=1 Tax=Phaseolus angularis TaxID=3914 RepID=A0A0L9UK49_PHAAN|nr:hypothetical protein LR48_Vigan05g073700 [Vigna angularis]
MIRGTMGLPTEAPTAPRANTRGSCSVVDLTGYSVLEGGQTIHGVPLLPHHVRVTIDEFIRPQKQLMHEPIINEDDEIAEAGDGHSHYGPRKMKTDLKNMLQGVVGKARGQLVQTCNKQLNSWECGYYVMSWIKTIIRAVITNDWIEGFKSTSPIPEDTIKKIRQEWAAYLLKMDLGRFVIVVEHLHLV